MILFSERSYRLIILSLILLATACAKKKEVPLLISANADDPAMSAQNIEVIFSDSGQVQARVTSPLLNRYASKSPYLAFPRGFKIYIFDSLQRVSSTIEGDSGIRHDNARMMEAWGNVVVRNVQKNEQLNTEHLIWDENRRRIWADGAVTITRPDQVLKGSSMESNEAFTNYSITNMSGEMLVKKDSL